MGREDAKPQGNADRDDDLRSPSDNGDLSDPGASAPADRLDTDSSPSLGSSACEMVNDADVEAVDPRPVDAPDDEAAETKLAERPDPSGDGSSGGLVLANFGPIEELLSTLVLAIDEKPLPVQIRIHKRYVQIKDFRVEEGRLVLRIIPTPKADIPDDD